MEGIKVLSLFDGISCGMVALERAGIPVDSYYASEIEPLALSISKKNYPEIIQLGDVKEWRNWDIDWGSIDLLIGGSPCFEGGTIVLTNEGLKSIEDVKVGDLVYTHENRYRRVLRTGSRMADTVRLYTGNDYNFTRVTSDHPYYTCSFPDNNLAWKKVCDLKAGVDFLLMPKVYLTPDTKEEMNGFWLIPFNGIGNMEKDRVVYNLEVEEDNSYTADGFIVHNCQGFSSSGKELNFEDPRSKLFFEYSDILNHLKESNPEVKFMLENVKMKKEWSDVISSFLGVGYKEINSRYFSAQNRVRYYWTNFEIPPHGDKGVMLEDIVEDGYIHSAAKRTRPIASEGHRKSLCLEVNGIGKSMCLVTVNLNNLLSPLPKGRYVDANLHDYPYRVMTPREMERLQTLPEGYVGDIGSNKAAKVLGNGWTVDVIAHILSGLKK